MHTVFFDLDGTLTDSAEGITKCAQYALRRLGVDVPDRTELTVFIGPPLRETFPRFGLTAAESETAVTYFRERYDPIGKFENMVYPGAEDCLQKLSRDGVRLYVATSKPEQFARQILEKFGLAPYFRLICGADMAGTRDAKDAVIAYLLKQCGERDLGRIRMVGDTHYDVEGAAQHGIQTVGVTWGYGTQAELEAAGAVAVADDFAGLYRILSQS